MTGKHYAWHKAWAVDLAASTATHASGLLVRFTQADDDDDDVAWNGHVEPANANATFAILAAQHGRDNAWAMLPRLMREADDVFMRVQRKAER